MRLLLVPILTLAMLTATGYANPYDDMPELSPLKPAQNPLDLPTIRGQSPSFETIAEVLDSPIPYARGPAKVEIDPKLTGMAVSDSSMEASWGEMADGRRQTAADIGMGRSAMTASESADSRQQMATEAATERRVMTAGGTASQVGYGALLVAMVCTTIGLVWMVFVAYDYRQRWMQSLTVQNERYASVGPYDIDIENVYDVLPFYDGSHLYRRAI